MMLDPIKEYNLRVNSKELVLICRALGGRLQEGNIEAAKELGKQIALRRISHSELDYRQMMRLKQNIEEDKSDEVC